MRYDVARGDNDDDNDTRNRKRETLRYSKGSYGSGFEPVEASSVGIRVMLNRGESEEQVREH